MEEIKISEKTKLSELINEYPWLKEEIIKISDKFKMLSTPMGKIMLGKADIFEMSRKSGIKTQVLISEIKKMIASHR